MLRNEVLQFHKEVLCREAERLFMQIGGLDRQGKRFATLRRRGIEIRSEINEQIDPKAIVSYYDRCVITRKEDVLVIDGVSLKCRAFAQLDEEQIWGAYVFFIHAGAYSVDNRPVMEQLMADMWGTAFVDATRMQFRKSLAEEAILSEEFGPGFFGMDVTQMKELAKLADPSMIGVEVRDTGILLPIKSCGGLYLHVKDGYMPLNSACLCCRGTATSCNYCELKR